ncbi:DUF6319 family protein [Glycomyces xiaoerkulensis]|uniref:DUF6319 family protein n=1 Tax=Glycomyces xiaoerkulensis TaxID=2038139 RepID=UPI000C25DD8C|nr:DUF6319 family protein [Glycomyces xiaoerkulensis]
MSLSSADIDHLESVLAQGKKPRVMFTDAAGQVAGRSGKVVSVASPREGDFVEVAFGSDQLPFAPTELRLPERGEASRAKAPRQGGGRSRQRAPSGPGLLPESPEPAKPAPPAPTERKRVTVPETNASKPEPAPARKRAPRQRREKHPELTITLTYEDGRWAVSAAKGARATVKGVEVGHSAALAMCKAAESAEVDEVVTEVVEKIRAEAAEEAEALRKRLEAAEAKLAELGE